LYLKALRAIYRATQTWYKRQTSFDTANTAGSNAFFARDFPYLAQALRKTDATIKRRLRTTVLFKKIAMRINKFILATAVSACVVFQAHGKFLAI